MDLARLPLRIAQLSDIHCGSPYFDARLCEAAIHRVNAIAPDLVVVAGDLTADGYGWEFEEAAEWLGRIQAPTVVIMGNHDARNVGELHFQRLFGERYRRHRLAFDAERAERLRMTGVTVVAIDSSQPDLNEGHVGREHYAWIAAQYDEPDDFKVFVIHHHLVSIPGTGRERSTVVDAGEVLETLIDLGVDIVLSGHKHVPFFWGLNGTLICNSGTAATHRLRGLTPSSWTELTVDAGTIKAHLHYPEGHRELAAIRSRANRTLVRESLFLTDDFRRAHALVADRADQAGRAVPAALTEVAR